MPLQRLAELETRLQAIESRGSVPADASQQLSSTTPAAVGIIGPTRSPTASNAGNGVPEADRAAIAYHVTDQGDIEYQGRAGERTFMQAFRDRLNSWPDDDFLHEKITSNSGTPDFLSSAPQESAETVLPSKEFATQLVDAALDAHRFLSIVHRPSFYTSFDLLYDLGEADYGIAERRFLPLLYAVLAYGSLYVEFELMGWDWEATVSQG